MRSAVMFTGSAYREMMPSKTNIEALSKWAGVGKNRLLLLNNLLQLIYATSGDPLVLWLLRECDAVYFIG